MRIKLLQLCPTLYDSVDYSQPGSSVYGDSPLPWHLSGSDTSEDTFHFLLPFAILLSLFISSTWELCFLVLYKTSMIKKKIFFLRHILLQDLVPHICTCFLKQYLMTCVISAVFYSTLIFCCLNTGQDPLHRFHNLLLDVYVCRNKL